MRSAEVGLRDPSQGAVQLSKVAPRAGALGLASDRHGGLLDGPDEKGAEGDELERSYIPLSLARSKMAALTAELAAMKQKHLQLIDSVAARYEAMTSDTRAHFEGIVDEVKARASLRLKENKASMEELREEIVLIQEAQAAKNAQYRAEIKAAVKEQGRLQQLLIDTEAEAEALRAQHDAESALFAARAAEIDMLMATRVPREELEALQAQKEEVEQRAANETKEFEEKHGAATSEADQLRADLADLTARHEALQAESEAAAASLAEKEEELQRARTEAEETKAALAAAEESVASLTTQLSEASSGSESALEEARAETQSLQDRLTEQEGRVALLETQLLTAQASAGSGGEGGEGSGPARVVLMPDPELQQRVRSLESEMNKLLRENTDLARLIHEREEAVSASNDALARAKTQAKQSAITTVGSSGLGAAAAGEDDEFVDEVDEDAPSEYEDQEVQEEVTEEVDEPGSEQPAPTSGGSAETEARRAELAEQLSALESSSADRSASIASLEKELKPKVVDYKSRLADFKSDSARKELEVSLGYDRLVDHEGGEPHDLRPADLAQLEEMLSWNESQALLKPQLAARVSTLKEAKKSLEGNKTLLAEKKNAIGELKSSGAPPEEVKAREHEFLALRTQMQADATELKASYASYEESLKDFKAKEADLQGYFAKFHVDDEHAPDKPRKLGPEQQAKIERLVALVANKSKERDLLKSLAEEVNQKNTLLKSLKQERDTMAAQGKEIQQQMDALPSAAPVRDAAAAATPRTVTKTFVRTVTKRVKKPKPMRRRAVGGSHSRANGTGTGTGTGGEAHVPAVLLTDLKAIDLKGKGKYAPREYAPVTPTVFKAASVEQSQAAGAGSATVAHSAPSSSSSSSGGSDPALKAKYDTLFAKSQRLQSELDQARQSSSTSAEALAARETELAQLREQIRILTEENPDERVGALSAQLAAQRAEVDAAQERHQERLAEMAQSGSAARAEADAKSEEIAHLKAEVKTMQDKVKQANAKAAAAARSSGGAAAVAAAASAASGGDGGGGVVGGVDPAVVAQYESQVSSLEERVADLEGQVETTSSERDAHAQSIAELQARIAELESEAEAHSGSLRDQLAARESELTSAHEARIQELEAQIHENVEKLRITKKKAKELHEALVAETARREALEGDVTNLNATIAGMEESTAAAKASVDGLKAEITKRDTTIATKASEIASLEETKAKLEGEVSFLEVRNVEEIRRRKEFQFKYEDAKGKVRVYARVRPFSKAEVAAEEKTLLRPGTNEWTLWSVHTLTHASMHQRAICTRRVAALFARCMLGRAGRKLDSRRRRPKSWPRLTVSFFFPSLIFSFLALSAFSSCLIVSTRRRRTTKAW